MEEKYYKLLNDILRGYDRCTPNKIVRLRNNQIFVFGTDKTGSQKYGAAGLAAKNFGAKPGIVDGPTGMCYALPTLGFTLDDLSSAVIRLEEYIRTNPGFTYLVTAVGCGHAGFDVTRVANMFIGLIGLRNVMLPETFLKVYRKECNNYLMNRQKKAKESEMTEEDNKHKEILQYFDERVHDVVRYLIEKEIPFNQDGGYVLCDENGTILAEAELGLETEKIVFLPLSEEYEKIFISKGYRIVSPEAFPLL